MKDNESFEGFANRILSRFKVFTFNWINCGGASWMVVIATDLEKAKETFKQELEKYQSGHGHLHGSPDEILSHAHITEEKLNIGFIHATLSVENGCNKPLSILL